MSFAQSDILVRQEAAAITANTTSGSYVALTALDVSGCEFVKMVLKLGTVAAGATMTGLKVQTSPDGSTYTDAIELVDSTASTFPSGGTAISMADTDDLKHIECIVDLRSKNNKYVRWSVKNGTTNSIGFAANMAIGSGSKLVPSTLTVSERLGTIMSR